MIFLQAAIGLAIVLVLFTGGILLIGLPLLTYMLNQQSRRKMNLEPEERLPFRELLLNFLAALALTILIIFLVFVIMNVMIDGRFT